MGSWGPTSAIPPEALVQHREGGGCVTWEKAGPFPETGDHGSGKKPLMSGLQGSTPCALKAGEPPYLHCLGTVLALPAGLTLSNRSLTW